MGGEPTEGSVLKGVLGMFNYGALDDGQFEELCRDVMSIKLGIDLSTFTKGADGGIDACDGDT